MAGKYAIRRTRAIEYLGSKCVDCGTTQMLEFDHVDQNTKSFTIAHRLNSMKWDRLVVELDKCVLRCVACHGFVTAYQKIQNVNVLF